MAVCYASGSEPLSPYRQFFLLRSSVSAIMDITNNSIFAGCYDSSNMSVVDGDTESDVHPIDTPRIFRNDRWQGHIYQPRSPLLQLIPA
jgi:hypothetical protein